MSVKPTLSVFEDPKARILERNKRRHRARLSVAVALCVVLGGYLVATKNYLPATMFIYPLIVIAAQWR